MQHRFFFHCLPALLLCGFLVFGPGCSSSEPVVYKKIAPTDALAIIQENKGIVLLDVRTEGERQEGYIEGSILIPHIELERRAPAELTDKNALILIYCLSGRRSAVAANKLIEMGYTRVYDFGGINDWPFAVIVPTKVVP